MAGNVCLCVWDEYQYPGVQLTEPLYGADEVLPF